MKIETIDTQAQALLVNEDDDKDWDTEEEVDEVDSLSI